MIFQKLTEKKQKYKSRISELENILLTRVSEPEPKKVEQKRLSINTADSELQEIIANALRRNNGY